jgi:uncharacterized lipoprotein YddW (UPF0748 family)
LKHLLVLLSLIAAISASAQPKYEVRAVWLTTIGGIDWPSTYAHDDMGITEQQRQLIGILDRLKAAGINTVLLQTRVRATTIYPSNIEPWDGCLSGKPGRSPGYDALQFAIDECHRRGMELHAWVVTIPVGKWNSYGCQQLRRRFGKLIMKIGEEGYMNPESSFTADYIAGICEEITKNYDVDGVHLDYIRYPETWRGRKSSSHITNIVRTIYEKVKFYKPWVKLSCSPIGKYDDLSRYRSNGWNARSRVAQDAQYWLQAGWMDQLYPMMYFQSNNFYPFALDWQENSHGRTISAGLGIYMLHPKEGRWQLPEVKRQLNVSRQIGMGHCYFRARFLLDNIKGVYDYAQWFDRHPALVPPMTWEHHAPPTPPTSFKVRHNAKEDQLSWSGAQDHSNGPYLLYNIYSSDEYPVDISNPANLIATRYLWEHIQIPQTITVKRSLHYAVTAIDRYGNESMPVQEKESNVHHNYSTLLPCDGKTLTLQDTIDTPYLVVCSLPGTFVRTYNNSLMIDVSILPEGIYELKSLSRKGITHRLGFFIIKR